MSDETTNLATLALNDAERRRTWIAIAIATVALAFAVWWGVTNPFEPGPDPAATPSPIATIIPPPQGQVTAAAGLPDAQPLTAEVLAQVESLWSLVVFRGHAVSDQGTVVLAGPTILYLVSPTGDTYQVTHMDSLGADALVAWDSTRDVALLSFREGEELRSYNMATGTVGPAIDPCDGATRIAPAVGTAGNGNWRLYTSCSNRSGERTFVHSTSVGDLGELVWDNNLTNVRQGLTLTVSGDVYIKQRLEWADAAAASVSDTATAGPGPEATAGPLPENTASPIPTVDPLPTASTQWLKVGGVEREIPSPNFAPLCEIVGPGRGGTIAARCDTVQAEFIWELAASGREPARAVLAMRRAQYPVNADGTPLTPVASCVAGGALAVQWIGTTATDGALTLIQDRAVSTVMIDQHPATHCFGASGTRMLIGGVEGLALLDTATGAVQSLIVTPTPAQLGLDPDQWVRGVVATVPSPMAGAEHQGVILAP